MKKLLSYAFAGSTFVFGPLGADDPNVMFIFAFRVLPTIIFISAFFAILYYIGVMQTHHQGNGVGHEPVHGREWR